MGPSAGCNKYRTEDDEYVALGIELTIKLIDSGAFWNVAGQKEWEVIASAHGTGCTTGTWNLLANGGHYWNYSIVDDAHMLTGTSHFEPAISDALRWTPSLGQDRGNVKVGFCSWKKDEAGGYRNTPRDSGALGHRETLGYNSLSV